FAALIFLQPSWPIALLLWILTGTGLAGIGMSVMHDANHGAYSSNKNINRLVGHTLNMVGGSVSNWKIQHNILHHTYTNITLIPMPASPVPINTQSRRAIGHEG
ncbi:MAG: fatty acid desaturase family protein, partial [Bacteroidota bacterium]